MATTNEDDPETEWKDDDFLAFGTEDNDDDEEDSASSDMELEVVPIRDRRPPWMETIVLHHHMRPMTQLHNEILAFTSLMEPLPSELQARNDLVDKLRTLLTQELPGATLEVFGSQATGLMLPTSDIDIVVLTHKAAAAAAAASPMRTFADLVREHLKPTYLETIANTRIPLVKFTVDGLQVDVSFNQPTGPPAAKLMKQMLQDLPPLRPVTIVLKYFLAARGLNEPYSGGVGSYMLQLMLLAVLQYRERLAPEQNLNLGSILIDFMELYGLELNYFTTGISVRQGGSFFRKGARDKKATFYMPSRPFSLALEDPLDISNDVGKGSFRMQVLQRAFSIAYRTLLSHVAHPVRAARHNSILASILPVSEYMLERRILKRKYDRNNKSQQSGKRRRPSDRSPPKKRRKR